MSISRKHYRLIAAAMRNTRPIIGDYALNAHDEVHACWLKGVHELAESLSDDNPMRFDYHVFVAACGA